MKRIKEVCALAGVTKRTLQYYDDEGLLSAKRADGNERVYDDDALNKLWRILLYKKMSFKLEEIKDMIDLSEEEQIQMLRRHLEKMKYEKAELEQLIRFAESVNQYGVPPISDTCLNGSMTYQEYIEVI